MYIGLAVLLLVLLVLSLRKCSQKTAHTVLLVLLFVNLALHFLKQAFPPYINDFPNSLIRSGLQNICAVSTVLFPFIYLFRKQNVLHDFAYFIGMCGGIGALAYPTEALGMPVFAFDTIRFYICHSLLVMVPVAAAILGVYRPRLRVFWTVPLIFMAWETIIALYEAFIVGTGLVPNAKLVDLLNPGFRNSSFEFGVRPDFAWAAKIFHPFVPTFLRTDYWNINGGKPFYFPVLWLIGPAIVYTTPVYVLFSSPFWIYELVKRRGKRGKTADHQSGEERGKSAQKDENP